jgi:hypothetical protein
MIWRRAGLHKGLEEDWTPQRSGGGLDSTKVWRRTDLQKDLEDWTPQRSGGGLNSTKVWRRTGLHIGLEEDWSPKRSGGLDSTKIWRRTELHKGLEEDWTPVHKDQEEDWTPQRFGGGLRRIFSPFCAGVFHFRSPLFSSFFCVLVGQCSKGPRLWMQSKQSKKRRIGPFLDNTNSKYIHTYLPFKLVNHNAENAGRREANRRYLEFI